jgi:hypothetical protein
MSILPSLVARSGKPGIAGRQGEFYPLEPAYVQASTSGTTLVLASNVTVR